jgi:hypothetical protein
MKHTPVHSKSLQQSTAVYTHRPVTGPNGISIAPPKYGVDFVDQQRSTDIGMTIQRQARGDSLTPERQQENRTGFPDHLKAGVETLSGVSMDDVHVHYNSTKPAALQALAYTQGTDIHVAPGQEQHLPHEAWHVVQQKQGRVRPTFQLKGEQVNDDAGLEHEADVMGARALAPAAQLEGGPEDEELLQGKFAPVQRQGMEDEELLQGKFSTLQRKGPEGDQMKMKKEPAAAAQLSAESPRTKNNTGLPDNLKTGIESLAGKTEDKVKAHYNSAKPAQLTSLAYAKGATYLTTQKNGIPINGEEGFARAGEEKCARTASEQTRGLRKIEDGGVKGVRVTQFVLDDEDLEGWWDLPDQWKTLTTNPNELAQLGRYRTMKLDAQAESSRNQEALQTRVNGMRSVSWDYFGERYHINLSQGTPHVTLETNPKIHYYFEGTGEDIEPRQANKKDDKSTSGTQEMFSALNPEIQRFIKKHWSLLLL